MLTQKERVGNWMPVLDELRIVTKELRQLYETKSRLIRKASELGVHWKELAFIDKHSAIVIVKDEVECTLMEAKDIVDRFLKSR
jgi:hypothetical protein